MSLLKISSFHSEICPIVLLSKINFFLFGVCPSVLLKYQLLPFLGFARLYFAKYQLLLFWLRLHAAPLYLCAIIPYSICHIIEWDVHGQKGPGYIRPSHLLGPLCCVGEKVKSRYPSDWATTNVPHTWAGVIPTISVLLGLDVPGHTRTLSLPLCSILFSPRLVKIISNVFHWI